MDCGIILIHANHSDLENFENSDNINMYISGRRSFQVSKIGQLIFTGIKGVTLSQEEKTFIESENIGGVILFSYNYESPAQLAELINEIQTSRNEYPLFIATDHEGGRVIRFKKHFTQFPAMLELAKTNSPKSCFDAHQIMAQELAACGINLNLSPVCDIWTSKSNKVIGDRAFGEEEETVSKFVSSAIRGLQTNGVSACAKHFPGHGGTTKDSHFDLPLIKTGLEDLRKVEFGPFVKAIKSRVDFVMMAHVLAEEIDSDLPCSLSEKAHRILREELKFKKIIISDDMQMGAIEKHFSVEKAVVMAINAGSNIVEYRDMENAKMGLEALKRAQKNKELLNTVISERCRIIDEVKKEKLKEYRPVYIPELSKAIGLKNSEKFLLELISQISALGT